jgi:alpha-tubulin suppressor-like RCC1 family protein/dipeptidyl aminopeptidase/acylaminoacyl peptidase
VDSSGLTSGFVQVSAGGAHTCAVTASGGAKCWGLNDNGQLGNGSTIDSRKPVDVLGLTSGVKAVSAGYLHTCAVTVLDGVKCWGRDVSGQLGDGYPLTNSNTPVDVSGLTAGVEAVSAGGFHTCARLEGTGDVKCWGSNTYGQLGNGTMTGPDCSGTCQPSPVVANVSGVTDVDAGVSHTCAVASGGAKCWGINFHGQLGNGSTNDNSTPVTVSGLLSGVTSVTAGYLHSCAVVFGGAKCWGNDAYGQLGNGTDPASTTPVDVSGLKSGVLSISAGLTHTCAVTTGFGLKCWGRNDYFQLGDASESDSSTTPVNVLGFSSGTGLASAGDSHSCAITTAGGVKCWGGNNGGQIGNGLTGAWAIFPADVFGTLPKAGLVITPKGTNVPVAVNGTVSITFDNVTSPGTTTATTVPCGPTPAGFRIVGTDRCYEISTSATFSGSAKVCFAFDATAWVGVVVPAGTVLPYRIMHNGVVLEPNDKSPEPNPNPYTGVVCASVTSFSPFALVEKVPFRVAYHSNADGDAEIFVMDDDGLNQTQLTYNDGQDIHPSWSMDGSKIAYTSDVDGNNEIYVMNADGSGQTRLTADASDDTDPTWSPDGSKIAFASNRDGDYDVYVMNADGTNVTNISNHPSFDADPDWSPDGTKIAFASARDGQFEVYVMNTSGSAQQNLTNNAVGFFDSFPQWSLDGAKISFQSDRSGDLEVFVMDSDGTDQTNVSNYPSAADGATTPFSPDRTRLAFTSDRDGDYDIYTMASDGSGLTLLTESSAIEGGPDWSYVSAQDADYDDDGCPDSDEVGLNQAAGGRRNPQNGYDYFNPTDDGENRIDDVLAVLNQYYDDDTDGNPGLPPYTPGYDPDTDRTDDTSSSEVWDLGPPNGQQRIDDILAIIFQYFHDCL